MYAFEDHHAYRDGPEDVDGYVTLRKIYWLPLRPRKIKT